jgi:5-methylcytosine-specific restriction endonuclease McrA
VVDKIISRDDARAIGLSLYFTGKPCGRGHIAPRFVCNWACRDCNNGEVRRRPGRNYDERLAYMRQWNRDHREIQKDKKAAYYRAHKDKWPKQAPEVNRARVSAWQKANPDKVYARNTRWIKAHPEYKKLDNLRRSPSKARGKANGGYYTREDTNALLEAQRFLCANPRCNTDLRTTKKHLDHVLALKRGGTNDPSNLQWLCRSCNLSKGARTMTEWLGD